MPTQTGSIDLKAAKAAADVAKETNQYFWTNTQDSGAGEGAGAHITEITRADFINDPANGGGNALITSTGMKIRDGITDLATFTTSGLTIKTSNNRVIANLGYGPGENESGTTSDAPYYTIGQRASGGSIGNDSTVEGYNNVASAWVSHAEGHYTRASGKGSHSEGYGGQTIDISQYTIQATGIGAHAEGYGESGYSGHGVIASGKGAHAEGYANTGGITASGDGSHAEGYQTDSTGQGSHSEGQFTTANGDASHAGGRSTIAKSRSQTVIGEYNETDSSGTSSTRGTYAFIIGNGDANARSNALTVDWNGNVNIPSGATYKVNGSELLNKYTRSSTGSLDWTNQTDGDAKIIAKSALAFWNGAYSGNNSNLSKCSDGTIVGTNSVTDSGEASKIPKIKSDGVLELRKYIDMHDTGSSQDYDVRLTCGTTTGSDGGATFKVSCGSFQINSNTVNDFVIASGTSGIWTYRKWKNGTLELFGQYSGAPTGSSHYSTINSFYAYRVENISLPSDPSFTNANYVVSANWKIGSGFAIDSGQVASRTTSKFTEYAIASASSQSSVVINMHVIGKWK